MPLPATPGMRGFPLVLALIGGYLLPIARDGSVQKSQQHIVLDSSKYIIPVPTYDNSSYGIAYQPTVASSSSDTSFAFMPFVFASILLALLGLLALAYPFVFRMANKIARFSERICGIAASTVRNAQMLIFESGISWLLTVYIAPWLLGDLWLDIATVPATFNIILTMLIWQLHRQHSNEMVDLERDEATADKELTLQNVQLIIGAFDGGLKMRDRDKEGIRKQYLAELEMEKQRYEDLKASHSAQDERHHETLGKQKRDLKALTNEVATLKKATSEAEAQRKDFMLAHNQDVNFLASRESSTRRKMDGMVDALADTTSERDVYRTALKTQEGVSRVTKLLLRNALRVASILVKEKEILRTLLSEAMQSGLTLIKANEIFMKLRDRVISLEDAVAGHEERERQAKLAVENMQSTIGKLEKAVWDKQKEMEKTERALRSETEKRKKFEDDHKQRTKAVQTQSEASEARDRESREKIKTLEQQLSTLKAQQATNDQTAKDTATKHKHAIDKLEQKLKEETAAKDTAARWGPRYRMMEANLKKAHDTEVEELRKRITELESESDDEREAKDDVEPAQQSGMPHPTTNGEPSAPVSGGNGPNADSGTGEGGDHMHHNSQAKASKRDRDREWAEKNAWAVLNEPFSGSKNKELALRRQKAIAHDWFFVGF